MPVHSVGKKVVKNEVVEVDGFEVIAIHIVKPINLSDENNPPRIRIVWGCTDAEVDTGETVEVSLEGQEVLDYMAGVPALYATLLSEATALGVLKGVLPPDAEIVS